MYTKFNKKKVILIEVFNSGLLRMENVTLYHQKTFLGFYYKEKCLKL